MWDHGKRKASITSELLRNRRKAANPLGKSELLGQLFLATEVSQGSGTKSSLGVSHSHF